MTRAGIDGVGGRIQVWYLEPHKKEGVDLMILGVWGNGDCVHWFGGMIRGAWRSETIDRFDLQ